MFSDVQWFNVYPIELTRVNFFWKALDNNIMKFIFIVNSLLEWEVYDDGSSWWQQVDLFTQFLLKITLLLWSLNVNNVIKLRYPWIIFTVISIGKIISSLVKII